MSESGHPRGTGGLRLSVVLPTFNERENLPLMIGRLNVSLAGHSHEIIIVDDNSPDGTWKLAQELAEGQENIRVIRRIDRKGLSSAVVEGFLLGRGKHLLVMDADLQHDVTLVPRMLEAMDAGEGRDLVIGSRYLERKDVPGWNRFRSWISTTGTRLANKFLDQKISDPLSGFFMIRSRKLQEIAPGLQGRGFKILLDILLHSRGLRIAELPFTFGSRQHGESKLDGKVVLDALDLLLSRTPLWRFNLEFVHYGLVGAAGVLVHFAVLWTLYSKIGLPYVLSLAMAIEVALVGNYVLNNRLTFLERRFAKAEFLGGLLRYNLACLMGTTFNIAIGWHLVGQGHSWVLASALGIWVGISWNYLSNKTFTWEKRS